MTLRSIEESAEDIALAIRTLRRHGFAIVRTDGRPSGAGCSFLGLDSENLSRDKHCVSPIARAVYQNLQGPQSIVHPALPADGEQRPLIDSNLEEGARWAACSFLGLERENSNREKQCVGKIARSICQNLADPQVLVTCSNASDSLSAGASNTGPGNPIVHQVLLAEGEPQSILDAITTLDGRAYDSLSDYERAMVQLYQKVGRKFGVTVSLTQLNEQELALMTPADVHEVRLRGNCSVSVVMVPPSQWGQDTPERSG